MTGNSLVFFFHPLEEYIQHTTILSVGFWKSDGKKMFAKNLNAIWALETNFRYNFSDFFSTIYSENSLFVIVTLTAWIFVRICSTPSHNFKNDFGFQVSEMDFPFLAQQIFRWFFFVRESYQKKNIFYTLK